MSQTVGDVIGRGWSVGRGMGQDFAQWKYSRGEAKLRQQLEAEAKAENKPIEQFIADNPDRLRQYEDAARDLYTTSGAQKRGVTGADGAALYEGTQSDLQQRIATGTNRRASEQVLTGALEDSQRTLAGGNALLGNYDATRASQLQADQIANTTGAMNPDGTFNSPKAMQGNVGLQAGQGDLAGAVTGQQGAREIRTKFQQQLAGQAYTMLQNPDAFGQDKIIANLNSLLSTSGEFGSGLTVQADADSGDLWVARNGQATGVKLTENGAATKDALSFLNTFSTDPEGAVQTQVAELKGLAEAETKRTGEIQMKAFDAALNIAKDIAKQDPATGAALTSLTSAMSSAKNAGWKTANQTDGSVVLTDDSGNVLIMRPNEPGALDPKTGTRLPPVSVTTTDGTPVRSEDLAAGPGQDIVSSIIALEAATAQSQVAQRGELAKLGVEMIGALTAAMGAPVDMGRAAPKGQIGGAIGKGGSRADRNNNPGNIEDRGQFNGMPGYLGSDGRFAKFSSPEAGIAAQHKQLERYMDGKTTGSPLTTVKDIIGTWSPQSDPTNQKGSTNNYATYVADRLGVDPTQPLTKAQIPALAAAMAEFESGNTSAVGASSAPATQARTAAIDIPGKTETKTSDGVKLPPKTKAIETNPLRDATALRSRRAILEDQLREFDENEAQGEQSAQYSSPTDDFPSYTPAYNRAQNSVRTQLTKELAQVRAAEKAALEAARSGAALAAEKRDRSTVASRYGLPPADPETSAALSRWVR